MLAQHYGLAGWCPGSSATTDWRGLFGARYKPLQLLLGRLTAPLGTIHCRRGRADDLRLPADPRDREGFSAAVQQYYREQTAQG